MDVHDKLDELAAALESARAVPMSASCMVNRTQMLALVDDVRRRLPGDLDRADALLDDAEAVIAEARHSAERIVADAHEERMRLVSETEVLAQAEREAGRIVAGAEADAHRLRQGVDDYVDGKLANFEIVLTKTLEAVDRGRAKIQGRRAVEELGDLSAPLPELDVDHPEDPGR
jgi:cell division septum initiation protein DivIVA